MRKFLFFLFCICLLLSLPLCAHAWEWDLDSAGTLTISGTGAVADFDFASATPWYGKTIKTVVVQEGITELGSYAFRNCTKLTSVTLPNSLQVLGVSAFEGCTALKTVTIGTGLRSVGGYAFLDCTKLSGVYITDVNAWCNAEFPAYSSSPMYYAKALYVNGAPISGTLELSNGVTKIPKYAFYGCAGITALQLPDTVKAIESDAFTYCTGLVSVDLGDGVTTVGSAAFSYCTALTEVTMGSVTTLGDYAFAYCSSLETAELSPTLQQMGQRVFYDCIALKTVTLPEGLNTMGSYVFYGCTGLETCSIPESLTVIPSYSFRGCTALKTVALPDTLTIIEKYAFYGCSGLTSLTIPENLTTLGSYAFYNCTGLETLSYEAVAMNDLSAGNYVFYKAGKTGFAVTIDAAVTRIPAYLFFPYSTYSPNINTVVLAPGSSCTTIGKYAFSGCKSLQKVVFAGSAPVIDTNAFKGVTAQCLYPAVWDRTVLQNYGGTLTWLTQKVAAADGTVFASLEDALVYSYELQLLQDVTVNATLQQDLYIDLNGYDLTGQLCVGTFKIYGMDSTTDQYTDDRVGTFRCTDGAAVVVPQTHCKVNTKRYLAVAEDGGYTFHRFYMGITHITLRPTQCGAGFKGVFYGDETVRSQIAATGFTLTLEGKTPKSQWKAGAFTSGAQISLLVRNFDPVEYGEAPLSASLCLQLLDGTVIESSTATITLRALMEQLNDLQLSDTHRQQIAALIASYPIMTQWKIENLL